MTVKPGFADNAQLVTGCDQDGTCPTQGTNFVYLHQSPSADSPLVTDVGQAHGGRQADVAGADDCDRTHILRV